MDKQTFSNARLIERTLQLLNEAREAQLTRADQQQDSAVAQSVKLLERSRILLAQPVRYAHRPTKPR